MDKQELQDYVGAIDVRNQKLHETIKGVQELQVRVCPVEKCHNE